MDFFFIIFHQKEPFIKVVGSFFLHSTENDGLTHCGFSVEETGSSAFSQAKCRVSFGSQGKKQGGIFWKSVIYLIS